MKVPKPVSEEMTQSKNIEHLKILTPRETPLSFGYMRLDGANPYLTTYRQMLTEAGVSEIFDDTPAVKYQYPKLEAMLAQARPRDTIVLVRFNHISLSPTSVVGVIQRFCDQQLNIRLVQNATAQMTPTGAVLSNLIKTLPLGSLAVFMEGNDGGGGNGGP